MTGEAETVALDPGSFRDPESRVLVGADGVYRVLSERGREDWRALAESATFARFTEAGSLVATEECDAAAIPAGFASNGGAGAALESALDGGVAGVLRHERIPFVSYPYEWSFAMLRDAALLQLDLLLSALDDGLILKDASPYNVQWRGARPAFVDIGSFERAREGEPWAGYRQFCSLNLNPLLLQAYKGIPFQPWLRGSIDGIPPADADRCFSLRDHFRRGVLTHVHLHARLERRNAARAGAEVKRELRDASFKTELIKANASRLRKLVARLDWRPGTSTWSGYRDANTYTEATAQRKAAFVAGAVRECQPRPRLGRRRERRRVLADRRRRRRLRGRHRLGPRHDRCPLPRPGERGERPDPAARGRRDEPLPRPRLARARAPHHSRLAATRTSSCAWPSCTTPRSAATSRSPRWWTGCARSTRAWSSSSRHATTRW